ncbi:MAG: hypothetical protein IJW76_03360 [Clostridia bacterium]|nr:hypothetical protein [Clostridia bacterium]MBQ8861579.1 hypothetical protein [Clostridia bacterium]
METNKIMANVEDCIETMKKKDVNINVKCTQFEALAVALSAVAVVGTVGLIVSIRNKAKLKKKITKKLEKAYAKKYLELEEDLRAEYEAKMAAMAIIDEDELEEIDEEA